VAVAGVATADYNAVCTALESAEYEHRVNAARAGNAYDLYVGRVCQTVVACKVGARI
jgi:hypothetical protein